jgi:autotransporter-associated beta strand protein
MGAANQIIDTSVLTLSSGTFDMAGFNETVGSFSFLGGTFTQGGGILTLAGGGTVLTMRDTTISGPLVLGPGSTVIFDATNNGTAVISGSLDMSGGTTTFDVQDGTAAIDMNLSGVVSNGSIIKIGAGQLAMSGSSANTYAGLTTITAGGFLLQKTAGINAIIGDVLVNGGTLTLGVADQIADSSNITLSTGTFDMGGFDESISSFTFQGGTFSQGAAVLTLANATTALTMRNTTIAGAVVLSGGGAVVFDLANDGTATLSGTLDMGGNITTFNIADGAATTDMNVSGTISNGGVTKIGSGRLSFAGAGANTYSSLTTVTAGELFLNKTAGTNAIAGNVLVSGGTLTLNAANQIINSSAMTITSGTFAMGANNETIDNLTYQGGTLSQSGGVLTLGNATTALTMRDTTISGAVVLSGSGSVVFDSTNNGTATLASTLALGGGTVTFNIGNGTATNDIDLQGVVSNGAITKTGAGLMRLSGAGANTYSGLTTVTAGTLLLDKTGVNAVGGNVLINGGTLTLNASDEIVDTAAMTITSGSFVMDTFSETLDSLTFQGGSMSQSSGVLTLSNAGAALTMRNTTIPGAVVLQASGAVIFDATNDGTATLNSTLDLGGGTVSFTIGDGAATTDMELQGVVSNGALTKLGTGQLLFSGGSANTYSGLTTVTAGSLVLSKTTGIDAIAGNVLIDGGTLTLNASAQINNASAMTITSGSFGMGTFSETLDSLTFQGGTLSQSGGVLSLANATTALTMRNTTIAGSVVLSSSGGVVFDATNNGTALLSGPLDLGSGTATFTIGNGTASTDMNLSGLVSNGALTKVGLGTLSLTGTGANTYSGVTTVTAGELLLNKTGVNAIAGDITVNGGTLTLGSADQIIDTSNLTLSSGTFDMGGFNETMGSFTFQAGTLTQGAGVLTLASGTTALTMRNTTISGAVVLSSSGSVVFDNTNNGTAILSGTLGLGGGTSTFDIADGAATTDMNVSGVISNGAISKIGAGQLAFSGASANTYTGLTSVTVGSLLLNKSSGVTSIPGDISVAGGTVTLGAANQIATTSTMTLSSGTFDMAGFAEVMGTLIYQGGTFTQGGAAVTLASASNALTMRNTTISGAVVLSGGGTVVFDNTNNGTAILSGTLNMSGSSTTFNIADGSAATDMNVSGTIANGAVTKTGAGTLAYSGGSANTYSGLTTVTAGTLDLNKTAGVDAIAGNVLINGGVVTLSASNEIIDTAAMTITSGTFAMGASSETIDNLTFQGGTLTQSGGTLTLANATTALTMRDTTIPGAVILSSSGAVVFDNTNNGTATLSGTLNLGGAATSFNIGDGTSATDMDISGVISNGSVTKIGAGALAFSGGSANTYTGLTTVTAGTLNLNKTAAVTAVPGNVLINGGTLSLSANSQIVNTATMTIISGAFDMGASSQTMSQLTFQGGTMSQSGGVLSLSHPVTALTMRSVTIPGGMTLTGGGSIVFDATNNGTASIDGPIDMGGSTISYNIGNGSAAIDMAISGIISNGAMTKIGTGLLYLTGANTYAGGTIVTAGSLMGNTTSLQGDISNSSTVIFTQNFDGTYADNLTGTGTLVLNGTGRVDFTGMCVQGSTQIVDGNLALNGTLNSPVLVDTSGTLSGNGIVTGSVNINGIVSPGNSIGILNVMGNVSQAAGSELDIEVNPTTADLFNITGSYTIQPGATLALFPDPGTYAPTTQYIIVDTTGGVIGTFSNVTVSLPSFSGEVIYHPSQILITFGTLPFIDIITNGNASKVAACVDAANQTGDMGFVVDELRMLNNTELYDAFDQMQPCIFKGAVVTQESNIDLIRTSLSRRMEECYQTKCNRYASIRAGATIWASANASRFTQMGVNSRAGHLVGYEGTTTSGTVGLDIAGGSHFTIGIAGAYSLTPLKFHADRGHAEIESAYAGFYTGVYGSLGYINISGLGSLNWYDESRKIEFAAIDRHATNRHMGRQALAHTDLGLIFPWAFLEFRPFGSGDFVWSEENHFKEKGAESLDLDVAKTRYQYLRGEVGLALSACLNTGKIKWIPDVKGSRVRELRHSGERYTCNFVDETCEFTVLGLYPTRDLWTYSVGFSFISPAESTTASIRYERQFNDTYNIESGIVQLMFRF